MRPGDWYVVKRGDEYLVGSEADGDLARWSTHQREAARFAGRIALAEGARLVLVRRRQAARGADFATAITSSTPRTA